MSQLSILEPLRGGTTLNIIANGMSQLRYELRYESVNFRPDTNQQEKCGCFCPDSNQEKKEKSKRHLEKNNTSTFPRGHTASVMVCELCRYLFPISPSPLKKSPIFTLLLSIFIECLYGNRVYGQGYYRWGVLSPTDWVAQQKCSESEGQEVKRKVLAARLVSGEGSSWLADRWWPRLLCPRVAFLARTEGALCLPLIRTLVLSALLL